MITDIEHYFVEKGQGDPLILLHGNGEDCGYFAGQTDAFARHFHVYAPDTRGHGKTPRAARTCSGSPTAGTSPWSSR